MYTGQCRTQSRFKTGNDVLMRAQTQKLFVTSNINLDPGGGMNKSCFYRRNKKFLPLSGKNSFTTQNRRKVANDAFYANHSQKQVGTDPFFNEKFNFSLVSKKRSLEQRTFAAFIRDTIQNHFSAYFFSIWCPAT